MTIDGAMDLFVSKLFQICNEFVLVVALQISILIVIRKPEKKKKIERKRKCQIIIV